MFLVGLPPGPAIQPMDIIPPTISAEDASKSTALFPVHTNPPTPGGSRVSKSPVVITDVSSPASIVFSPIGTDLMAAAQRKNAESPRPTVNLHHRASPMSGVAPTPIQQFYPSQPPSQPRFPVPVPQQVSIPRAMTNKPPSISVNQIAQDATALRPPRPPITDARNIPGIGAPRLSNSPMNYAQIAAVSGLKVANNERCIVWEGVLEWFIPGNNNTNAQQPQARTAHQLLSEVWVPVAEAVYVTIIFMFSNKSQHFSLLIFDLFQKSFQAHFITNPSPIHHQSITNPSPTHHPPITNPSPTHHPPITNQSKPITNPPYPIKAHQNSVPINKSSTNESTRGLCPLILFLNFFQQFCQFTFRRSMYFWRIFSILFFK